jgi:hypothetical protein
VRKCGRVADAGLAWKIVSSVGAALGLAGTVAGALDFAVAAREVAAALSVAADEGLAVLVSGEGRELVVAAAGDVAVVGVAPAARWPAVVVPPGDWLPHAATARASPARTRLRRL